jgi:hypothetical protein
MKKLLLTLVVALSFTAAGFAQVLGGDYKAGIGLRLGGGYYDVVAASFKFFPAVRSGIELNLGIRPYGGYGNVYRDGWTNVSVTGAYQHHFPIANIEGFKWFVGGGLTAFNTFSKYDDYRGFGLGIFPTGGVEYKFPKIPLAVSADLRPTIAVVKPYDYYDGFYVGNFGIGARYTFR